MKGCPQQHNVKADHESNWMKSHLDSPLEVLVIQNQDFYDTL